MERPLTSLGTMRIHMPRRPVGFHKSRTGAEMRVRRALADSLSGTAVLVDKSVEDVVALDALCREGDDVRGVGRGPKV